MTNPLIPRLREGEGADRELDYEILRMFDPEHEIFRPLSAGYKSTFSDAISCWKWNVESHNYFHTIPFPKFTKSLDACIALAEKVLPDCVRKVFTYPPHNQWPLKTMVILSRLPYLRDDIMAEHKDACRAFLIALITAKETEHDR